MEKENSRNGTESMTMPTIMIWGIQIKARNMFVLFLEGLKSILILGGEERDVHQQRQVRQISSCWLALQFIASSFITAYKREISFFGGGFRGRVYIKIKNCFGFLLLVLLLLPTYKNRKHYFQLYFLL